MTVSRAVLASFALFVSLVAIRLSAAVPIVDAVKSGDIRAVKALLGQRADVNAAEPDGTTALHWAVNRNDLQTVELLLQAGASVRLANRYGVTPVQLAATNGGAAVVTRLLDAGADPNAALPDGETVLMTAARAGDAATVEVLLARGASVNAREPMKGQTALMWAAAENNAAVVKLLVDAGADIRERSRSGAFTPYLFAVRGGHIETARLMIDLGANVSEAMPDGTSALVLAVMNAHYELASVLLDQGADPDADDQGWTALHQIAWSRRHNAGFNLPGPVPTGNVDSLELARKLVQRGANVNARIAKEPRDGNRNQLNRIGGTAFLMAAKSCDVPLMRTLLDLGADPSLTTDRGTTAVMAAAGVGIWAPGENPGTHEEALAAVRLALEAGGGRVNDIDRDGETALHGAVYRGGAIPVIQFLIDQGAVLDVRNKKGWTPLTAADGVEYTPAVLKRYPEAAALLRQAMRERGLTVPEPGETAPQEAAKPAAQSGPAARSGAGKTIWDGVFTEAQAARGQQAYGEACARCHMTDLLGERDAPPLVGAHFATRWAGFTAEDIFTTIKRTMPQEAPDSLGAPVYADIVGYMLQANGAAAGSEELPPDPEALKQLRVTAR